VKLADLRILITGAASGIGRACALDLLAAGARVAALDLNRPGLDALTAETGGAIAGYHANVAKQVEVVDAFRRAAADLGSINAVLNSAGIYRDGLLLRGEPGSGQVLKMPLGQWQAVVDVDLTGTFLVVREAAAQMVERGVRPGVIINVSSVSRAGNPGQGNYSAAKAGVVADSRLWARELAPYGIRVASIAPGLIRTPILDAMLPEVLSDWVDRVPLARLGDPAEIAAGVRFVVECDYFNGACLEIDGGLTM
jgi:3-oxoacyl-[acyl-carrier protein] reductase